METQQLYKLITEQGAGISIDSRNVKPGDVFFALQGENFDGNDFAFHRVDLR